MDVGVACEGDDKEAMVQAGAWVGNFYFLGLIMFRGLGL